MSSEWLPEAHEIIGWIIEAGGIPVLAHPYWEGLNKDDSTTACQTLAEQGLRGLEVFYGTFSARHISFNLGLAKRYDLLMTGGSDFHGTSKPDIALGERVEAHYMSQQKLWNNYGARRGTETQKTAPTENGYSTKGCLFGIPFTIFRHILSL